MRIVLLGYDTFFLIIMEEFNFLELKRKVASTADIYAKELLLWEALAHYEQTILSVGNAYLTQIKSELIYLQKMRELSQPNGEHPQKSKVSTSQEIVQNSPTKWLDAQDVMALLHISKRSLQTLRANGTLPFSPINNKFFYKLEDVERVLGNHYAMYKIQRGRAVIR